MKEQIVDLVSKAIDKYRDEFVKMAIHKTHGELKNERHLDNFLSHMDLELNRYYRTGLKNILNNYMFVSEESDPEIVNQTSELKYLVIVDPLDTTELAVRALNGYTQLIIYDIPLRKPIMAVVGDFFHEIKLYYAHCEADGDHAYLQTRSNIVYNISPSSVSEAKNALITNFFMKPSDRFSDFASKDKLLSVLSEKPKRGRIGLDFGSIGLCHVASGSTDAFIEFSKGFYLWDLLPGSYILQSSGGVVRDNSGEDIDISFPLDNLPGIKNTLNQRIKFVAASNASLGNSISNVLD